MQPLTLMGLYQLIRQFCDTILSKLFARHLNQIVARSKLLWLNNDNQT